MVWRFHANECIEGTKSVQEQHVNFFITTKELVI